MDKKDIVREFLSKFLRTDDFGDDDDIFASGAINSLFAMQLILFLEKKFKIKVEKQDLNIEHFRSLNAITEFLDTKMVGVEE